MQDAYYYKLLELRPGASPAEIKTAYRKLVKRYHPDLSGNSSSDKFNEIVLAYRQLSLGAVFSPGKKKEYRKPPPRPQSRPSTSGQARPQAARQPGKSKVFLSLSRYGRILMASPLVELRRNAAIFLGRSGKMSAYGYLRRGLWDTEQEVVLAVVKAIASLNICQAGGELGALFLKTSRQIKLAILDFARLMIDYPGYAAILSLGLHDSDPVVRNHVLLSAK